MLQRCSPKVVTFDALLAGSAIEVQMNFSTWVKGVGSTTGQRAMDKRINKNRKPRSDAVRLWAREDNQWVGSGGWGGQTQQGGASNHRETHMHRPESWSYWANE